MAYAASVAAIADQRGAHGDNDGKARALEQAARIYEDVCLAAPSQPNPQASDADINVNACLRFSAIVLTSARQQIAAEQHVDERSLRRANLVLEALVAAYQNNAEIKSRASRMHDQIDRAIQDATAAAAPAQ
jgi:hypothetical protein